MTNLSKEEIAQVLVFINNKYHSLRAVFLIDYNAPLPGADLIEYGVSLPEDSDYISRQIDGAIQE